MFVHSAEEAAAAEEANIDMICTSHDASQFGVYNTFDELKRIREAAPNCFMQSGGAVSVASEYEAMKLSHKYLSISADCVYGGNWSYKWIKALRNENIPINSHVGLIPGKANWIGGFRAIGKTADEALSVLKHTLELQEAGVIGVELEVVPPKVAAIITKKVDIMTLSMGSGSDFNSLNISFDLSNIFLKLRIDTNPKFFLFLLLKKYLMQLLNYHIMLDLGIQPLFLYLEHP